jgi:guanylate kinase
MDALRVATYSLWKAYATITNIPFATRLHTKDKFYTIQVPLTLLSDCESFWLFLIDSLHLLPGRPVWYHTFVAVRSNGFVVFVNTRQTLAITTSDERIDVGEVPPTSISPVLVVGGKSGAGKSTLLRAVKRDCPGLMFSVPQYTTRRPRDDEQFGAEYYFVNKALYTHTPSFRIRFSDLQSVRKNFYWVDRLEELRAVFRGPRQVYTYTQSLRKGILNARARWPRMTFAWIEAPSRDILNRLSQRRKAALGATLAYNDTLSSKGLADVVINNSDGNLREACIELRTVVAQLIGRI